MKNYNIGDIGSAAATGLDAFFASEPSIVTPSGTTEGHVPAAAPVTAATLKQASAGRRKVGSLSQLDGFQRVSAETLIHRSTNDLWALRKEGEDFYIERLFQDGQPLKG